MTDELPAQWALDKAAVVAGYQDWAHLHQFHDHAARTGRLAIALARYIEKHEPAPVDPDLELAREICAMLLGPRANPDEFYRRAIQDVASKLKERGK